MTNRTQTHDLAQAPAHVPARVQGAALGLLLALAGTACAGSHVRGDDVNGANADHASHAIFGEGFNIVDVDGDGADDTISFLFVYVSDRPDLCADLAADPTLVGVSDIELAKFFVSRRLVDDATGGFSEGESVTGAPPEVYVDAGLFVKEAGVVRADALGDGGLGTLSLHAYASADHLRGSAEGRINLDYTDTTLPGGTLIDAALEATFDAEHCQALSDEITP